MTEQGIDIRQLRDLVVRPALEAIGLGGAAAEELMIGTTAECDVAESVFEAAYDIA